MKWFHHLTKSRDDADLDRLLNQLGFAGVCRWWWLLETISIDMDESDRCFADHSVRQWCKFLRCKANSLPDFLSYIQTHLNCSVTIVEPQDNLCRTSGPTEDILRSWASNLQAVLRIECPKLLELKDNHSRNLQARKSKIASRVEESRVESSSPHKNAPMKTMPSASFSGSTGPPSLPLFGPDALTLEEGNNGHGKRSVVPRGTSELPAGFLEFWTPYPWHVAKQDAIRAWKKLSITDQKAATASLRVYPFATSPKERGYGLHAATFLNARRWEDEEIAYNPSRDPTSTAYNPPSFTNEQIEAMSPEEQLRVMRSPRSGEMMTVEELEAFKREYPDEYTANIQFFREQKEKKTTTGATT